MIFRIFDVLKRFERFKKREPEQPRQDPRRGGSIYHFLLALIEERASYGYELAKALDALGLLADAEASIYPPLRRMQNEGLLEGFIVPLEGTGLQRKYYRITPEGERKLEEYDRQWRRFRQAVDCLRGPAKESEADTR